MRVVVLGASPNPSRFSFKAIRALRRHDHEVVPINPAHSEIDGLQTLPNIAAVQGSIDTVTLYVGEKNLLPLIDSIVAAKPRRIIANPGAESDALRRRASREGIDYVEACTLVMLSTGTF